MKTLIVLFSILIMAVVSFAGTTGGTAPAVGKVNVALTVPKVASVQCMSIAAGKTGVATFNVSGTTMVNWKAFTSDVDSSAAIVKRKFNANTAYIPASGEYNLPIESKASALVFGKFSTANNTTYVPRICVEMN